MYKRDNAESEISIHLDLGLEEVGQSLHVEPGLPRDGPQHDTATNIQLVPQGVVGIHNMTRIISKGVQTGRRLNQRVLFFRQSKGRGNLRDLF